MYQVIYTKKAIKDIEKINASTLNAKAKRLIEVIKENPFQNPPPFEKLLGNLERSILKTY